MLAYRAVRMSMLTPWVRLNARSALVTSVLRWLAHLSVLAIMKAVMQGSTNQSMFWTLARTVSAENIQVMVFHV